MDCPKSVFLETNPPLNIPPSINPRENQHSIDSSGLLWGSS